MADVKEAPKPKSTNSPSQHAENDGLHDHLIGLSDIAPGEECWIYLDVAGAPTAISRDLPPIGTPYARGRVNASLNGAIQGLTSVSGAELGPLLNSSPDRRFEPSPPEAYAASAKKAEAREKAARVYGDSTLGSDNPQTARANDEHPTNARNRGIVEGSEAPKVKEEPKVAAKK